MAIPLSAEDYAELVEQAPILIWRAGTDALCDYFNARWLAFTGRTLDQEMGNGWAEGVHPEDLDRCLKIYLEAFQNQETFEMEYRLRHCSGAYRWLLDRGVPRFAPDGRFEGYIGSCIDVTARVDAECALRAYQEARLSQAHGLLPICVTCKKVRDDEGYWNGVEKYIQEHSEICFSHGFCPDCAAEFYGEELRRLAEKASGGATGS